MNNCTLLLSTYDNGEDCWEGFFKCLQDQWPEMDMPVVINTETKDYSFPGYNITTYHMFKGKVVPWGERLIEHLKRIESKFVLLFLEDYWLDQKVDDAFFREVLKWMEENNDIASFSFYPCMPGENIQDGQFPRFELRPQKCKYKCNCQVSLWRTEKLLEYLRPHESAWEWEIWGSIRASKYKDRMYTLMSGEKLVFSYGDPAIGCLIHKGKWNKDVIEPFIDRYELNINLAARGFEDWEKIRNYKKPPLYVRIQRPNLAGRIKEKFKRGYRMWLSLR